MNTKTTRRRLPVLLYIPNIIDYIRLVLLAYAWINIDAKPLTFLVCYISQAFLDFFDGYFARILDQSSLFGAWLDVVLDNFGRGILWVHVHPAGYLITMVEWIAFSFIQKLDSKDWKSLFENTPFLVRQVFKNNFKTPIGITAITAGLQGLPIMLYIVRHFFSPPQVNEWSSLSLVIVYSTLAYAVLGRALSLYVELWLIGKNLGKMIKQNEEQAKSQQ